MGKFIDSIMPYENYKAVTSERYFVDKTALLNELIPALRKEQRFFCVTRPRRFGKTIMANMVAAFFGKARDSKDLFDKLEIAKQISYQKYLNQYHVIFIDFSEIPRNCSSYQKYISRIEEGLYRDLQENYADLKLDEKSSIWDLFSFLFEKKEERFIFVIDEWDAVFRMPFMQEEEKREYLLFLKLLLKGKSYVELVYMTGILPIAKYSSGSELNMFVEYHMTTKVRFSDYFGFSDKEVDTLYEQYLHTEKQPKILRNELREWYDGYYTAAGKRLYNPRSIVCSLQDNQVSNYWTSSGPYDEIFFYIRNDIEHIRDDLALLVAKEGVDAKIEEFSVSSMKLTTKNQIYSALVVYGLLTYYNGQVKIPNKELMLKYEELLQKENSLGYVYQLAKKSAQMLKATLAGDEKTMAEILEYAHDTETPILSYNHEIELSAVVNLVYLAARDNYKVEREDKAGKGYVDFLFYPMKTSDDCLILELKVDRTPEEAIQQIIEKNYLLRFRGKLGETPKYTGRVLAVGISYNKETKKHSCKVEVLSSYG